MPVILNDRGKRLAYLFGRQSGIRATGETLEQVQEQLKTERSQRVFDNANFQEQIGFLLRDNAELRLEIARRDREAAFAAPVGDDASNR